MTTVAVMLKLYEPCHENVGSFWFIRRQIEKQKIEQITQTYLSIGKGDHHTAENLQIL